MRKLRSRYIAIAFLGLVVSLALGMLVVVAPWEKRQYDPNSFCPLNGQYVRTVILIDATDSLSQGKIKTILENINALRRNLELYEWIGVFLLNESDLLLPQPVVALCNPGNERTANPLYQNPELIRQNFEEKFNKPIRAEIEKLIDLPEQGTSPIMEMVSAVALNKQFDSTQKRRLIVISDMLQNVPAYSQYGSPIESREHYADWSAGEYAHKMVQPGLLQGVDVEVLYVKREGLRALQTRGHIEFWARYFAALGGKVQSVTPI